METKAPEEKPYKAPKRMIGMAPREGSQSARTRAAERVDVAIRALKRP